MGLLRLITCGHVDDGKSTLLGRLLHDTKSIFEDQWAAVQQASVKRGDKETNLALLTDGLRAERERGITIDVAYRYFATPRRKFILADCPGHFEYTRNMVTGASSAQLALLLVDVRNGLTEQTCRHAFLASLLRIRHLIVCVNKMDLVEFRQDAFERVRDQFMAYAERLEGLDIQFIPISALAGDNVVEKSARMPWHAGPPLLYTLETVYVANDANHVDARFPVQTVIQPSSTAKPGFTGYAGQVASGIFRPGDELVHLPGGESVSIKAIHGPAGPVAEAFHPMSVVLELEGQARINRGEMLARPNNLPTSGQDFDAMLCWLAAEPFDSARRYLLRHTTCETGCELRTVRYKLDITTLHRNQDGTPPAMNDLARVSLHTATPVFHDSYKKNRLTGSILLVDELTNATVAAGMILR
jgi:sulfate adenylyltransferase subunit 1